MCLIYGVRGRVGWRTATVYLSGFSRSNTVLSSNPFSRTLSCFPNAEKVNQSPLLFVSNSNSFMLLHYGCCLSILSQICEISLLALSLSILLLDIKSVHNTICGFG